MFVLAQFVYMFVRRLHVRTSNTRAMKTINNWNEQASAFTLAMFILRKCKNWVLAKFTIATINYVHANFIYHCALFLDEGRSATETATKPILKRFIPKSPEVIQQQ